ncbi:MAG TPA: outer membrane beta-barrel protein [Bryobacteraceae bacterium]|nr:outer membrane beta-barrel protein [Bryobacteraceae bacterium]
MKIPLLLLFPASLAWAQPFTAGIKAGLPLTDFLNTVNGVTASTTNRYIVGPMVELRLPFGLGVEFDALYRHFDYTNVVGSGVNALTSTGHSGAWEFPLVAKYKFPSHIARPYVEAGVAWDTLSGVTNAVGITNQKGTVIGAVLGGGIDIHLVVLHISPGLRYTRWTSQHFNLNGVLTSNQNQAEFLVGFTF